MEPISNHQTCSKEHEFFFPTEPFSQVKCFCSCFTLHKKGERLGSEDAIEPEQAHIRRTQKKQPPIVFIQLLAKPNPDLIGVSVNYLSVYESRHSFNPLIS